MSISAMPVTPDAPVISRRNWLWLVALFAAVFLAYQPAWRAGFIWDDPAHVTRPSLRSLDGLARIWFEVGATQQYYPLLHSAFWVEHRLFGGTATGYHLVNIALHALNAGMLGLILRRLRVPGAALAAGIFALHPVMVESVAWVSELKNVLSGLFYFSAALAYLRFDRDRNWRFYALALLLFVLGLLCKTVTATLPGALLVVLWWQRGRLNWKRDVLPVVPFFIIGAAAGIFTSWVEQGMLKEDGAEYDFSLVERSLIAGRAICFYAGKLLWPANLIFVYPRWTVSQSAWWQYLFPAAVLLVLAVLWRWRARARGPLASALFFMGTLFPALGFVNVFPFIYSFVADHFQYLASLGIIVPFAAGTTWLTQSWPRPAWRIAGVGVFTVLGVLTWRQSATYGDAVTLYETTLTRNPACWLAHNNLGVILVESGQREAGIAHYRLALQANPSNTAALRNLAAEAMKDGRPEEAVEHLAAAARLRPRDVAIQNSLGAALLAAQRFPEAIEHLATAVRLDPGHALAHGNLASALARSGRVPEAIAHLRIALRLDAGNAAWRENLRRLEALRPSNLPRN